LRDVAVMPGEKLAFAEQSFDVIIASDVFEHIDDDTAAVKECRRVLKPGGQLIVFVPAFSFLWSGHDEVNFHKRRYTRAQLLRLLAEAGLSVERSSYWNFLLFFAIAPLRVCQRLLGLDKRAPRDQLESAPGALNTLLFKIVQLENRCLKNVNFPFGVSVWAIASAGKIG
jgi:SAM-dependent methyltransferase